MNNIKIYISLLGILRCFKNLISVVITKKRMGELVMTKFCILCETEIDDEAIICDNCGEPQIQEEIVKNQSTQVSKSNNQGNGKEIIICKEYGGWVESALLVHRGQVVMTSKRLIYYNYNFLKTFALGAFVYLTDGEYEFEILLKNIKKVSEGKHNLGKVLEIETKDNVVYKLGVKNRQKWIDNISKHIKY